MASPLLPPICCMLEMGLPSALHGYNLPPPTPPPSPPFTITLQPSLYQEPISNNSTTAHHPFWIVAVLPPAAPAPPRRSISLEVETGSATTGDQVPPHMPGTVAGGSPKDSEGKAEAATLEAGLLGTKSLDSDVGTLVVHSTASDSPRVPPPPPAHPSCSLSNRFPGFSRAASESSPAKPPSSFPPSVLGQLKSAPVATIGERLHRCSISSMRKVGVQKRERVTSGKCLSIPFFNAGGRSGCGQPAAAFHHPRQPGLRGFLRQRLLHG